MTQYCKSSDVDWFWKIVDSSERSLNKMCRTLEKLSKEELINFQRVCWHLKEDVNPFTRYKEMKFQIPISDSAGDSISGWIIGEGRAFFEKVRDNPADFQKYFAIYESLTRPKWDTKVDVEEYEGYQRADIIAKAVYFKKFDEDLDEAVEAALDEEVEE